MLEQYLDSWELQYIRDLKDHDVMAWADDQAKMMYPKHSWVYDKLLLSRELYKDLGLDFTWDLEKEMPNQFPVIVKPRENLDGLSKDCYTADSPDEIEDFHGFIAQKKFSGNQYSIDLMVQEGKVAAKFPFLAYKNSYGELKMFESTRFSPNVSQEIARVLPDYTGIVNVELVSGMVIEMHLRPSLQFYDICGGFIEAMPEFVKTGKVPQISFEQTYSRVYRTKHDGFVSKAHIPPEKPSGVRSIQLCWTDGYKLSESDSGLLRHRYMVINGTDLTEIEEYGRMVRVQLKEEK